MSFFRILKRAAKKERKRVFNPETTDPIYWPGFDTDPHYDANRAFSRIVGFFLVTLILAVTVFVCALMIWFLSPPAHAHSWYPTECCQGQDCQPVPCDSITETREGYDWKGLHFLEGQVRPSLDKQCHVCAGMSIDTDGIPKPKYPRCIFILPAA
jgi:hypothetical protein